MAEFEKQPPVHVIRLRGPAWVVYQEDGEQKRVRVKTPCEIDPGLEVDCVVQRGIGGPTGITPNQRIELAFAGFKNVNAVRFNDQPIIESNLDAKKETSIDVTSLIQGNNLIEVQFSPPAFFGDLEMRIFGDASS